MNTRQKIVDALHDRLCSIAGIKTVAEWKILPPAPAELPLIDIRDTVDEMPEDGIGPGRRDHELNVELRLTVFGTASAQDVREYVNSIVAAIGTDDTFNSVAYGTEVRSVEINMDETEQLISAAQIDLTILYRSSLWSI